MDDEIFRFMISSYNNIFKPGFQHFFSLLHFNWAIIFSGDGNAKWKKEYMCNFVLKSKDGSNRCSLLFKSLNQLREHKNTVGHVKVRKMATKNKAPKKQLRID